MASKKSVPAPAAKKKSSIAVDENCPLSGAVVHEDYDCILNQTNIGANNNKFYVIQLLAKAGKFYAWTRWGRVGETGQSALVGPASFEASLKVFSAKFKDKTSNRWDERASFKPAAGRYMLIEVDRSADNDKSEEVEAKLKSIDSEAAKLTTKVQYKPSTLDARVQKFMHLIFDQDMFKGAMAAFDIDVKKVPLGQLSQTQVDKGFEVLDALSKAIKSKKTRGHDARDLSLLHGHPPCLWASDAAHYRQRRIARQEDRDAQRAV